MSKSDDIISRADAIDAFIKDLTRKERRNLLHTWSTVEVKYYIIEMLERLTSAEPKTGKWVEHEDPYGFFDTIPVCSECGHTTKMRERYNYCPNCGARMVREDGEE